MRGMAVSSDVLVVGAGVVGCATAFELVRRGVTVRLVDDRVPGMGATQASAGMLAPHNEAREDGALLKLTASGLDRFDDFVARVTDASGVSVEYRRTGTLDVALEADSMPRLARNAERLNAKGIEATMLDAGAVRAREPQLTDAAHGGLLIHEQGYVSASGLTAALLSGLSRRGTSPPAMTRVRRIRREGSGLAAETDAGTLVAGTIVLAGGSWSGQVPIDGVDPAPVRPIRGQLLRLGWRGDALTRVTWSEHCYLVPWADGTLLVGATVEDAGFEERATVGGIRELMDAVSTLVPRAGLATFEGVRVGLRPATPDDLPIIGPSEALPNLMYATGHYRNGVLLAPLTAELVAGAIVDGRFDPLLDLTRPSRFGRL